MNLSVAKNRIMCVLRDKEEKKYGNIILPDEDKVDYKILKVLEDKTEMTTPGMHLLTTKYSGVEVTVDGTKHIFIKPDDILAVVNEE